MIRLPFPTLLLFLVLFASAAEAQSPNKITLAAYGESLAFPFTNITPFHPGGEIGITLKEKKRGRTIRNVNTYAGFFHHERVENAIYLRGEYAYRPIIKSAFTVDMLGSLGYMHTFYPGEIYELNEASGDYEKARQSGRSHALASVGLGITYIKGRHVEPFVRQEMAVESPFANGIPVIIHSFLKVGVNLKF